MSEQPIGASGQSSGPYPERTSAWRTGHDLQFYDADDFLIAKVRAFLLEGIRAGQPMIVIATRAHEQAFRQVLQRAAGDALETADITWLDARDTLAALMEGRHPSRELFEATIGNVFEKVLAKRHYLVLRAYGEMVNLLWTDGNIEAAIALEDLWNELAAKYSFNLLCAYSMANTFRESNAESIQRICAKHGTVMMGEGRA